MASFPAGKSEITPEGFLVASSENVNPSDYFSAQREYSDIKLRPVLVPMAQSSSINPDVSCLGKSLIATFPHALYYVEIQNENLSRFSLCDALLAALALLGKPLESDFALLPFDPTEICEYSLSVEKLSSWSSREGTENTFLLKQILNSRFSFPYELDELMWIVATVLVEDDKLLYASLFIRESFKDYQFLGDEVSETLLNYEKLPDTISEGVRIENAIHNCYKAIEAIHGGNLPQDKRKIQRAFLEMGIDVNEQVGYSLNEINKEPIIDKLLRLRSSRDYKSAHGRIGPNRKSTYYELMDFQEVARYMVMASIQHHTGINGLVPVSY